MSQCFNPDCLSQNPNNHKFCQKCGQILLLKDHFRAIRYLGEGGFGRTFVAIDEHRRNSQCVIKQFLPVSQGNAALEKCIQLFEQEAELLEKLGKHPQIPDLLAYFEQDNKLYLVQEFIEGENLFVELKNRQPYNQLEIKNFFLEMLPILDFIHKKGVIHRDIKPENIIRRKTSLDPLILGRKVSDLVLIDFGVSKNMKVTVMTKLGTITGTPGYAPAEQFRGIVQYSSDLYSLAVTAIRLLTKVFPQEKDGSIVDDIFDSFNLEWTWKQWLQKQKINIDKSLADIIDKMLLDKISERFPSAAEVIEALQYKPFVSSIQVNQKSLAVLTTKSQRQTTSLPITNVNYYKLKEFLQQKNWREADAETGKLMLQIMNREEEGYLKVEDCQNFPHEQLRIIDKLWVKYSQGKFGFSVQKQIWIKCGINAKKYDYSVYCEFADQVGWRNNKYWISYSDLTFNINAIQGHLPSCGVIGGLGARGWGRVALFSCIEDNQ